MKQIPKNIEYALDKRYKLAMELIRINTIIDNYATNELGITDIEGAAIATDVKIFCEPGVAYGCTKVAMQKALNKK